MKTNIHYIFLLCSVLLAFNGITMCAPEDKTRERDRIYQILKRSKAMAARREKKRQEKVIIRYKQEIGLHNIEAGEFKEEDALDVELLNHEREEEYYNRIPKTEYERATAWFIETYHRKEYEEEDLIDQKRKIKRQNDIIERKKQERERDRNIKMALMYPAFIIMKLKSYSFF